MFFLHSFFLFSTYQNPRAPDNGKVYVRHYGAWAGLLAWIPLLGSLVTVAMGYLRTNPYLSFFTIGLGKYIRYQLIVSTWMMTMD